MSRALPESFSVTTVSINTVLYGTTHFGQEADYGWKGLETNNHSMVISRITLVGNARSGLEEEGRRWPSSGNEETTLEPIC